MHIKMKLSFSIFLVLVLIQAAHSVPVNSTQTEQEDAKPKVDDVPTQNNPTDQNEPLDNLKKMSELFETSVKGNFADAKEKVDNFLTEINPIENGKKLKALIENFSNQPSHLKQSIKNSTELLQNALKDDLNEFQAKVGDFLSQMNSDKKNN